MHFADSKNEAGFENREALKHRAYVLEIEGLSKTARCERGIGLLSYIIFCIMIG
jgi:hypothetical protein